jgi:hypothetical protein
VVGDGFTDQASNNASAGLTSGNYLIDTEAPTLVSAKGTTGVDTIVLTFSEILDAVNFAQSSAFYVTDGTLTSDPDDGAAQLHFAIEAISVSGTKATLTVDPSIASAATTWILTYVDAPGNGALVMQDLYGSDVGSFTTAVI